MTLLTAVKVARELATRHIEPGDIAVDATAGNGHDTHWLAELVGQDGQVYAFDIQETAVHATLKRVQEAGFSQRVTVTQASHHLAAHYLPDTPISLALFNLGYLPGGDKTIVTQFDTTQLACEALLFKMKVNGLLILVIYPGHEEGRVEATKLEAWACSLDQKVYTVQKIAMLNQINYPPFVIAVQKKEVVPKKG